jgi:hypothetical protein
MAARTIRASLAASRTIIAAARPAIRPVVARAAWVQPISRTFTASSARLGGGESEYDIGLPSFMILRLSL